LTWNLAPFVFDALFPKTVIVGSFWGSPGASAVIASQKYRLYRRPNEPNEYGLLVPAMLAGNFLGDRIFDKASAKTYRRVVVLLLAGLGAVAAVRGLVGLAQGL